MGTELDWNDAGSLRPCGGGLGRGVTAGKNTVPNRATPTPSPSPQGGGEQAVRGDIT